MLIARNSVVTLNYKVTDSDGNTIDEGADPMVYLHGGYGGIFDRLEEQLQGKKTGDSLEVKLLPEDAFGDFDAKLINVEARDLFPSNIEIGMQFERGSEDDDGEDDRLFTITDITDEKVAVDGNHPLAGVSIVFACTVTNVRTATAEELSHGHVHGEHGHHH